MVGVLLELGWSPDEKDPHGWTALHHAASVGYAANVAALPAGGAAREARRNEGLLPADVAERNGHSG